MLTRTAVRIIVVVCFAALATLAADAFTHRDPLPSFEEQFCSLEPEWRTAIRRGYYEPRVGQVSVLPRTPAYMAGGGKGWSHSGPWDYVQHVPLVFYGPGPIPAGIEVDDPATMADVAPTVAALMKGVVRTEGKILPEVARLGRSLRTSPPRVIVTVVLDGAGWNVLDQWPDSYPTLQRMIDEGVSYRNARVGSSPSVTPAVHTTLGTGLFPASHGISSVEVLDENGVVVDSFFEGESSRYIQVPTVAESWDEQGGNRALVGMVGHVPWHLGMIGKGAEKPGGDRDHAVWLDSATNDWISNPNHYELPKAFEDRSDLQARLDELDRSDGPDDDMWMNVPLDDPARVEEVPAFTDHHVAKLLEMMSSEGYGRDAVTDLLFTNFKQIDLLGHYFNMASDQVHAAVKAGDAALAQLIEHLETEVGRGRYVVVATADHGQQPDADAIEGFGIDPNELAADIVRAFGPIVQDVAPTEIFLDQQELDSADLTVAEVARFVGDYRLRDNTDSLWAELFGTGVFAGADRVFDMAVPAAVVADSAC